MIFYFNCCNCSISEFRMYTLNSIKIRKKHVFWWFIEHVSPCNVLQHHRYGQFVFDSIYLVFVLLIRSRIGRVDVIFFMSLRTFGCLSMIFWISSAPNAYAAFIVCNFVEFLGARDSFIRKTEMKIGKFKQKQFVCVHETINVFNAK